MNWFKKNYYLVILLVLGVGAGFFSFSYIGNLLEPHNQPVKVDEGEKPNTEPNTEPQKVSEEYDKWLKLPRKRNITVLIDNDILARPQAGLQEADLVFELPIEGGTTRYMAVFSRFSSELVGPIRSARDYMIDLAKAYDPIFVHAGGSPQAFAKFSEIGNLNGLEGGVDRAFWRLQEREAPHNLYSDTETIRRVARQEGFREDGEFPEFNYLEEDEILEWKKADKLSIDYGNKDFRAEYLYDKNTKAYLRFTGGVKHFTLNSEQLKVRNIIVQMVNANIKDEEGRLNVDLLDKGKALYFSQGQVNIGYWEKNGSEPTKYFTAEGEEVKLIPGNTWVNLVPVNAKIVY